MKSKIALFYACLTAATASATSPNDASMMNRTDRKVLVVYFSATGTTHAAAERLAGMLDADLFEIVPQQPYSDADLDWHDKTSRSSVEMNAPEARPAIARPCADMARYDTVFIGFPVWWDLAPRIVNTFIESHDLAGKRVVAFATSGGSSVENSARELKRNYPALRWGRARLLNRFSKSDIEAWQKELGR